MIFGKKKGPSPPTQPDPAKRLAEKIEQFIKSLQGEGVEYVNISVHCDRIHFLPEREIYKYQAPASVFRDGEFFMQNGVLQRYEAQIESGTEPVLFDITKTHKVSAL
ncbi:hypothetical protein [Chitinophaga sp. YIM B06452]|uniref:hypothetical protein n=1 Tax=Chitinophaga sp. YIM B06452 TaxID=3082158 RepID=UPI0031FEF61A